MELALYNYGDLVNVQCMRASLKSKTYYETYHICRETRDLYRDCSPQANTLMGSGRTQVDGSSVARALSRDMLYVTETIVRTIIAS